MNDGSFYDMEHGAISINKDSLPRTWIGHLDSEDELSENEIASYIRSSKPALFEQLNYLPRKSSDVPLSFGALHRLKQLSNSGDKHSHNQNSHVLCNQPSTDSKEIQQLLEVVNQIKYQIDHKLANGFSLYEDLVSTAGHQLMCSFPLCQDPYFRYSTASTYFLIVCDSGVSLDDRVYPDCSAELFCSSCFDLILPSPSEVQEDSARKETEAQLLLDGVSDEQVLIAANRLYPPLTPRKVGKNDEYDNEGYARQAYQYESTNSTKAMRLRAHKQYEIDEILSAVSKYEKTTKSSRVKEEEDKMEPESSPEPSVAIIRPPYMDPPKERYKKQGMTRYSRIKYLKELKKEQSQADASDESSSPSISPRSVSFHQDRICSCREPEGDSEIIRCSAEQCSVGWFHLECSGLERIPTTREKFLCCYCSDGFEACVTENSLEDVSFTESTDYSPVSTVFPLIVGEVDEEAGTATMGYYQQSSRTFIDREYEENSESESEFESKEPHANILKWRAVNGPLPETNAISTTESNSYINKAFSSCTPDNQQPSPISPIHTTTTPQPSSTSSSTSKSPNFALSPPQAPHTKAHTPPNTPIPSTPPLRPNYKSSKPWGTPINVESPLLDEHRRLVNMSPLTPSPLKRRYSRIVSTPESEEGGEIVPLVLG